jgi:hypothetical protein
MFWKNARSILMLGMGCLTSPCCTPFLVPLGLSLLSGTPIAVWLTYKLSWIYGALTLVSILSFILAIRWMQSAKRSQNAKPKAKSFSALDDLL